MNILAISIAAHIKKTHYDIAITTTKKDSKINCLHYQKR